jgi:hypothetical protein
MPKKHPNKDIAEAIKYAESKGWVVIPSDGHSFAQLRCPKNDQECRCGKYCQFGVWSTPKNPTEHAKKIKNTIDKCIHQDD